MARDNVDYIFLNQGEPIYLKVNDEYVFPSHDPGAFVVVVEPERAVDE